MGHWADPFDTSLVACVIVSFVIGLLMSVFSPYFHVVLLYLVAAECILYFGRRNWSLMTSISVISAYLVGWIVGRTVYDMETYFSNESADEMLGC